MATGVELNVTLSGVVTVTAPAVFSSAEILVGSWICEAMNAVPSGETSKEGLLGVHCWPSQ